MTSREQCTRRAIRKQCVHAEIKNKMDVGTFIYYQPFVLSPWGRRPRLMAECIHLWMAYDMRKESQVRFEENEMLNARHRLTWREKSNNLCSVYYKHV